LLVPFIAEMITDSRTHHVVEISHPICGHVLHHLIVVHRVIEARIHVHIHHVRKATCVHIDTHVERTTNCSICLGLIVNSQLLGPSIHKLLLILALCPRILLNNIRPVACQFFTTIRRLSCFFCSNRNRRGFKCSDLLQKSVRVHLKSEDQAYFD